MLSDIALKKELITAFASIPDTADGSSLDSLTNMLARASPVLEKFTGRATKRANEAMLNTYNYPFDLSPKEVSDNEYNETRKRRDAELKAYMAEQFKMWTPEQQSANIQEQLEEVERKAGYAAMLNLDSIKSDEKEAALATWYTEFCKAVDAKVVTLTAMTPGDSVVVEPPSKKVKVNPTPTQIRITLGHSFKEEFVDQDVLLFNLKAQLKMSQENEARVKKTYDTRKEKAQVQKDAMAEHKAAKKQGKASVAPKKALGGKTDLVVMMQDHADLELANWFQQHAVAIKAKIALFEAPVVV